MSKIYEFREEHKKLFEDVVFVVEATFDEQHNFWKDYFYEPRLPTRKVDSWKEEGRGHMITIGECDDRPVVISIFYASLNNKKVMFYEATSQVVDYKMVDEWIEHFSLHTVRYNNRWAHCDSSNFHHCLEVVGAKLYE